MTVLVQKKFVYFVLEIYFETSSKDNGSVNSSSKENVIFDVLVFKMHFLLQEDSSTNPDEQEDEINLLDEIDETDEISRDSTTTSDIVENLTDEDDEEDSSQYPDTSLQLKFVSGGKYVFDCKTLSHSSAMQPLA